MSLITSFIIFLLSGCDGADYSNVCDAHGQGVSVSRMGTCNTTTTSSATQVSPTVSSPIVTTVPANIIDVTTSFVGVGDFPTDSPITNSSVAGSTNPDLLQSDAGRSSNSAFSRSRPIHLCIATAFVAILVISVILPDNGIGSKYIYGFGKFSVTAVAISSLYSKSSRSFKAIEKRGAKFVPSQTNVRNLQSCSFNVEILFDGCTKSLAIDAPASRIIDMIITDQNQTFSPDDKCTSSLEANLTFPATNEVTLDSGEDITVEAFDEFDFRCMRAIEGRPFVDVSGGGLQAMPCVMGGEADSSTSALSWTVESLADLHSSHTSNDTRRHYLLGEYWTQRALGEHASVASFSAFSIALMTNQAPSNLVVGALKAGLDEVRHAKTSFKIASILAGKDISPGPLPSSRHEFHHDLTALAMAVAREGCVDETISAFTAALEAVHISEVLEKGIQESKYSSVDRETLIFIRDELTKIAMDESNHSALAWQTLQWVCSIDSDSCDAVDNDVFNESNLEKRFLQRVRSSLNEDLTTPEEIRSEWKKIFHAHHYFLSRHDKESKFVRESTCEEIGVGSGCSGLSLLTSMTDNVLSQIYRS